MQILIPARWWCLIAAVVISLLTSVCSGQQLGRSQPVVTNRDVVMLAQAGFSEAFILQTIATSRTKFSLNSDELAELARQGITEAIIGAMSKPYAPSASVGTAPDELFGPKREGGSKSPGRSIQVFVEPSPISWMGSGSHPQAAEIMKIFGASCPDLVVTNQRERASFTIVLKRGSGKWLGRDSKLVVLDRSSDMVYQASTRTLGNAVRGFCRSIQSRPISTPQGQSVQLQTSEFPWAMVGTGYAAMIETAADGRCPTGTVGLSVVAGSLPGGLAVRGQNLVGTPTEVGTFHFSVRGANNCSSTVKSFELIVTGKPVLRVFPAAISFVYHLGQAAPAPQTVQISASWPNLPYAIQSDAGWLVQHARGGITPNFGSGLSSSVVPVGVDPKNLAPGAYQTAIRFSTWLGANAPTLAVTLTILPPEAAISTAPERHPGGGNSRSL